MRKNFIGFLQFVDNQAEQCFLKGFYYRLQGKFQKSIEWYKKAIELKIKIITEAELLRLLN